MTNTGRKPTATYTTTGGQTITATRVNPEQRSIYGRRYAIAVDGEHAVTVVQNGRSRFRWPGQPMDYIANVSDACLLIAAAGDRIRR